MSDKTEGQRLAECLGLYLASEEGARLLKGTTSGKFLENRIWAAYMQGWADGRIDAKLSEPPAQPSSKSGSDGAPAAPDIYRAPP